MKLVNALVAKVSFAAKIVMYITMLFVTGLFVSALGVFGESARHESTMFVMGVDVGH